MAEAKPCLVKGSYLFHTEPALDSRLEPILSHQRYAVHARRALRFQSNTTLNNGYLGSRNDEERSEMRYLV